MLRPSKTYSTGTVPVSISWHCLFKFRKERTNSLLGFLVQGLPDPLQFLNWHFFLPSKNVRKAVLRIQTKMWILIPLFTLIWIRILLFTLMRNLILIRLFTLSGSGSRCKYAATNPPRLHFCLIHFGRQIPHLGIKGSEKMVHFAPYHRYKCRSNVIVPNKKPSWLLP
jgi:hypothetical protein